MDLLYDVLRGICFSLLLFAISPIGWCCMQVAIDSCEEDEEDGNEDYYD